MKKFIISFLFTSAGMLFIILLFEFKYKSYETSYDYIYSKFINQKNEINVIYIGNSHTGVLKKNQINSQDVVSNLSSQGQDLFKIYVILKKYVPLVPQLKRIYIGLDYEMLGQNQTISGEEFIERQLYKYTDTLYHYDIANIIMSQSNFFRANRDLTFLFKSNNNKESKQKANTFIPVTSKKTNLKDCEKRALEHSLIKFKKELCPQNLSYIVELIKLCKLHNVSLIFFNPPKRKCFCDNINYDNSMYAKKQIDSIMIDYKIPYYDFIGDTAFIEADFTDYDHLNLNGVKKMLYKLK